MVFRAVIISLFLALAGATQVQAGWFDDLSKPVKALIIGAVGYYSGGVVAGVATGATSMAYDELIHDGTCSADIEKGNNQQLVGFAIEQIVFGTIAIFAIFLAFTLLGRWLGIKRERKDQRFREMETPISKEIINAIKEVKNAKD